MKKTEYKIEIVCGHILVNDGRGSKVLIDTGSPLKYMQIFQNPRFYLKIYMQNPRF